MLLVDDLLAAPFRGLMFVLREIDKAVQAERAAENRAAMAELSELHRALDRGQVTEAEFDAREQVLLQRLDSLQGGRRGDDDDNAQS